MPVGLDINLNICHSVGAFEAHVFQVDAYALGYRNNLPEAGFNPVGARR